MMFSNVLEFDEKRMREIAIDAAKIYCEEHFKLKTVAIECLGYERKIFLGEVRYSYMFEIWDVFERTYIATYMTEVKPILKS